MVPAVVDISIFQDTTVKIKIKRKKQSMNAFLNRHNKYSSYAYKSSSFSPIRTLSLLLSNTHTHTEAAAS